MIKANINGVSYELYTAEEVNAMISTQDAKINQYKKVASDNLIKFNEMKTEHDLFKEEIESLKKEVLNLSNTNNVSETDFEEA